MIQEGIQDIPKEVYLENMAKSIVQGTCWKVSTKGETYAFVYIYKVCNRWLGASIYSACPVAILLAFTELFAKTGYITINYVPHKGGIVAMKSLVTSRSIRAYRSRKGYLQIALKDIVPKFEKLYKRLGITQVFKGT